MWRAVIKSAIIVTLVHHSTQFFVAVLVCSPASMSTTQNRMPVLASTCPSRFSVVSRAISLAKLEHPPLATTNASHKVDGQT